MACVMTMEPASIRQQTVLGIAIGVVAALLVVALSTRDIGSLNPFKAFVLADPAPAQSVVVAEVAPSGETEVYIDGEYVPGAVTGPNADGDLDVFLGDSFVASVPTPR